MNNGSGREREKERKAYLVTLARMQSQSEMKKCARGQQIHVNTVFEFYLLHLSNLWETIKNYEKFNLKNFFMIPFDHRSYNGDSSVTV